MWAGVYPLSIQNRGSFQLNLEMHSNLVKVYVSGANGLGNSGDFLTVSSWFWETEKQQRKEGEPHASFWAKRGKTYFVWLRYFICSETGQLVSFLSAWKHNKSWKIQNEELFWTEESEGFKECSFLSSQIFHYYQMSTHEQCGKGKKRKKKSVNLHNNPMWKRRSSLR